MIFINHSLVSYYFARQVQEYLISRIRKNEIPNSVYFCQHYPVITYGKRAKNQKPSSELSTFDDLAFEHVNSSRGGLETIHLPGQLLCYPCFNIRKMNIGVKKYIISCLCAISEVIKVFGLDNYIDEQKVGVWTKTETPKKVVSAGIEIVNGISNHGFSINLNCNSRYFAFISPCGEKGSNVTSLTEELSARIDVDLFCCQLEKQFLIKFGQDNK